MRLVDDWRRVMARSLSFWMSAFGILAMILPELWYAWTGEDYDPFVAWWVGMLLLVAGLIGRLVPQNRPHWQEWLRIAAVVGIVIALAFLFATEARAEPASEARTLEIAVPFIAKEEGERLHAYWDIVGIPTACFGETNGIHMGMSFTHEQCMGMLKAQVALYRNSLHRYFTPATIDTRLPATRDAAYTSTAYNCGVTAIGKSTATSRLNAGNVVGGCEALTWWDRAGHRVIRGLFERRTREKKMCLIGAQS